MRKLTYKQRHSIALLLGVTASLTFTRVAQAQTDAAPPATPEESNKAPEEKPPEESTEPAEAPTEPAEAPTEPAEEPSATDQPEPESEGSAEPEVAPEEQEPASPPDAVTKSAAAPAPQKPAPAPSKAPPAEFFADEEEMEFEAVAEVEAPPREPTKRVMDREQLTRIPGTRGDALRAVEVMPGVARTDFAANDGPPLLRGGSAYESQVLLDGAPVPLIYHFGGLTSFFNSHLLESVELTPGNFSARYGRAAGGIVEARVRDPKADGFHALVELSAIDSFALAEGPVSKKTQVALAARRSNIDFFFDSFVPEGSYQVLAAPIYWDYQAIVAHRFNEKHKLRALLYGSQDSLELYFGDSSKEDPALQGSIEARMAFHRAQLELESQLSEKVQQKLMLSVGPARSDQTIGQLSSRFRIVDIIARSEWSIFASKAVRIDTGMDLTMFAGTGRYTGPAPAQGEGNPDFGSLAGERYLVIEEKGIAPTRPGAFLEASLRPAESLLLIPGVRADYIIDGNDWTVDPRLGSRLEVTDSTTVKGGVGLYSQPPEYFQIMDELGNPDAKPFRTMQTSLGVEQKITEAITFDVEGFYKRWYDRLVGTEGGAPPRFVNDGRGRAYGLETLIQVRPSARSQAFLAYTLARSERQDRSDPWRLFDYDQTHNLSLTANYDLGKGWIVGARFRYVTGNPYNEIESAVYDATTDTYAPLVREVNGGRETAFHQLDVRVEKRFEIGPVDLTTFLEVLNVYNAKNQSGHAYSFDYSESQGVTGMPIFPNLGIRGEL